MSAPDPFRYFRIEARELCDQLAESTLALDRGAQRADEIAKMLRVAHTLKGAARVVKCPDIADHAHEIEGLVTPLRDDAMRPVPIEALLARVDAISKAIIGLAQPETVVEERFTTLHADPAELQLLIGGLNEASAELGSLRADMTQLPQKLQDAVARVDREVEQAQQRAERLRLSPVKALFSVLALTAKDAARAQNKKVTFEASGGEVRLEATALAQLQNALVQCVRNAVAHGIEREGRVRLEVQRRGRNIIFRCIDDGKGVDITAVRTALARRGIEAKSDGDVLEQLLKGGASTAANVTELSGRGVGLDVVRETATRTGGTVNLSTSSRGTTIEISLPMALAAVDAFVVEDRRMSASIAVDRVRLAMRVTPAMLVRSATGTALSFEGATVPFAWLSELLGGAPRDTAQAFTALVINGDKAGAIGVERVLGRQDMLLRPLPPLAPARAVVAGIALDAHGEPMIVLDPDAAIAAAQKIAPVLQEPAHRRLPILVVDDSLTTRMLEQSILESAGYEVELATCAEEGLEKARQRRYGLFLVDVEMPGMDGFSFVEHARAAPETRAVPAILITSRNAPEDRERGVRAGAQDYMVKSEFDQSKLLARIRALME